MPIPRRAARCSATSRAPRGRSRHGPAISSRPPPATGTDRRPWRDRVPGLISLDGARGEGGGQILRTAVSLAAATGQGFQITRIRANRAQPGLRPQHLAAVRAAALACDARVGGAFDGSPDLRFEPGTLAAGDYRFEIAT